MWPHGINIPLVSLSILSQQIVQQGGSKTVPFFLQCFSSILTIGSLATADFFARFAFYLLVASSSLILRIISKRLSEAKLELKFSMKLFGLNSLYYICIRKNSRPLKTSIKLRNRLLTKLSIYEPIAPPSYPSAPARGSPDAAPLAPGSSLLLCTTTNWGAGIYIPPT